jgi:hypothetical protein
MCNLYSITTSQEAIRALFRVMNCYVGNLPPMQASSRTGFRRSTRWAWRSRLSGPKYDRPVPFGVLGVDRHNYPWYVAVAPAGCFAQKTTGPSAEAPGP